jgi:polyisoprenoid-binding protein YceI
MSSEYEYDPRTLNPVLSGLAAGAVGAIAGSLVSLSITTPDEIVANTLSLSILAMLIGLATGELWRRVRATSNGLRTFYLTTSAAFVLTLILLVSIDRFALQNLLPYAVPVAGIVFLSVGLLTPAFSRAVVSSWIVVIPVVLALAVGIGLLGRGKTTSGELSLEDVGEPTVTASVKSGGSGGASPADTGTSGVDAPDVVNSVDAVAIPGDLAAEYTVTEGVATYTVPETLRGLEAEAVGRTESVTGTIEPSGSLEVTVDLLSLQSDQPRRDGRVREMFAVSPEAIFTTDTLALPSEVQVNQVVPLTVDGSLTINEVTREVTWAAEARVVEDAIEVAGEIDIVLTDYGVTPPTIGGIVEVEDAAHLEIVIRAEATV